MQFTTRTVVSKPQAIKEKALAPRSSRVPLSNIQNDIPHRQSDDEEHVEVKACLLSIIQANFINSSVAEPLIVLLSVMLKGPLIAAAIPNT